MFSEEGAPEDYGLSQDESVFSLSPPESEGSGSKDKDDSPMWARRSKLDWMFTGE